MKRRPGAIYAITTCRYRDERGLPVRLRLGYIGKTVRRPEARWAEHRCTQPWSDLIVECRVIWRSDRVTDFGLWWREIYYILTRFPVYNYQWNRWNPRRVPVYRAAAQRSVRQHYQSGRMWTR